MDRKTVVSAAAKPRLGVASTISRWLTVRRETRRLWCRYCGDTPRDASGYCSATCLERGLAALVLRTP